jgi:hypothetical protein
VKAIERLKSALGEFVEPDPPPLPRKGKTKQPVFVPPTLKEIASQISAPANPTTIADLRYKIAPFVGEALLGMLYAALLNPAADEAKGYIESARKHDLGGDPWGNAAFDEATKTVRGNIARLGHALAEARTRSAEPAVRPGDLPRLFTTVMLNTFETVDQRSATDRAQEYVARSIDLGEDVLGLYPLGDQAARAAIDELDTIVSLRRAQAVRTRLDQGESNKAIESLSLSELYFIGQRYLKLRMASDTLPNLVNEPGALGALARVIIRAQSGDQAQGVPEALKGEINQFGTTTLSRTGLMQLDLREGESYEQTISFVDARRLAERFQDFKLAIARASYRQGHPALLPLSPMLARSVLDRTLAQLGKSTGRIPPERDWQGFLSLIQSPDRAGFAAFVEQLAGSGYVNPLPKVKWDDAALSRK